MGCGVSGLKDCKSEVAESTNDDHADITEIETEEHKETNTNHIVPVLSSEQLDLPSNNSQHDEPKEEIPYNQETPDVLATTEQQPDLTNDVNVNISINHKHLIKFCTPCQPLYSNNNIESIYSY